MCTGGWLQGPRGGPRRDGLGGGVGQASAEAPGRAGAAGRCRGSEASGGHEVVPSLQSRPLSFLPEVGCPLSTHTCANTSAALCHPSPREAADGAFLPLCSTAPQGQAPVAHSDGNSRSILLLVTCSLLRLPLAAAPWGPFSASWKNPGDPG